MRKIAFLITLLLLFSCSIQKKEVLGKYEYRGDKMIDSITIENNLYVHKIFNNNGKLMYHGSSTWELMNDRIVFLDFYDNEDYELKDFFSEEQAKKFLTRLSCPIYKSNQEIIIETNADENIRYVKKSINRNN